jgi:hypothetical protein
VGLRPLAQPAGLLRCLAVCGSCNRRLRGCSLIRSPLLTNLPFIIHTSVTTTVQEHHYHSGMPLQASSNEQVNPCQVIQKTRTGCATCRKRRVKCDEQRPHCKRCVKAQRQCEGYPFIIHISHATQSKITSSAGDSHSASEDHYSPSSDSPGRHLAIAKYTEIDGHAFAFYRCKVSNALGGAAALDIDFWQDLVLQAADTEPAVQHAVFALGSLFRHASNTYGPVDKGKCACENCQSALHSYNKSITLLSKRIVENDSLLVALIACVLFICLESLQGNAEQALNLIHKGCAIVSNYGGTSDKLITSVNTTTTKLENRIDKRLIQMFTRLQLLSSLHGRPIAQGESAPKRDVRTATTGYVFTDWTDARSTLYTIMEEAHQILRDAGYVKWLPAPSQVALNDILGRQIRLQASLQAWHGAFHLFSGTQNCALHDGKSRDNNPACTIKAILEAYFIVTFVWLATMLSPFQKTLDNHIAEFRRICVLADQCMKTTEHDEAEAGMPNVQFEMGWIPVLYFTATKCRDPETRLRAVELLSCAPEREGLWSRTETVMVARRVIELEMTGMGEEKERSRQIEIDGVLWPQEEARFHDVDIGMAQIVLGRRKTRIKYLRRTKSEESGEYGWVTFEEDLVS